MHNHFNKNLNLKKIILERKPKVIVECGAGDGELTRQIASLLDVYPFEFHVISDKVLTDVDSRVLWYTGLSYEILEVFAKDSIDLCIIDTDHNYWTLMKELVVLLERVSEGGMIAMHDVHTFYHDTGMAMSYWDGKPYPKAAIESYAPYGGLGDAMIEFLREQKMRYKLFAYTTESHGAAILQRHTQNAFAVIVPGPNPAYAKQNKEKLHASV